MGSASDLCRRCFSRTGGMGGDAQVESEAESPTAPELEEKEEQKEEEYFF